MRTRNPKLGFTLIELLVVIAIIAILAALLFPVFARAKARSQLSSCLNNLKQWNTAMLAYMGDHNDRFPCAGANAYFSHPSNIGGTATFYQCMWKTGYIRNKAVLWCPLWTGSDYAARRVQLGWSYWYYCPHSNPWVAGQNSGKAALCGYSMSDVRRPSLKPSITEIWSRHESDTPQTQGNDGNGRCLYPVAYCDGHVASRSFGRQNDDVVKYLYIGRDGSLND